MTAKEYQKLTAKTKSAGEITAFALNYLKLSRVTAWRQNNLAVRGRKFIGLLGVFDMPGICEITGKWVAVETKTINDRPSADQLAFQAMIRKAGGVAEFIGPDSEEFKTRFDAALKKIREV